MLMSKNKPDLIIKETPKPNITFEELIYLALLNKLQKESST